MEIASRIASGVQTQTQRGTSFYTFFTSWFLRTSCPYNVTSAIRYRFGAHGTEACPMTHASLILPPITCSCPTRPGTSW